MSARVAVMPNDREDEITEEQLREWLQLASLEKINIFMNHNDIIKKLCVALLTARGHNPWRVKR